MLLQLCVLGCLVSAICSENSNNDYYNSTISRREIVDHQLDLNTCKNVAGFSASVVAILSTGVEVMCDTEDGGGWTVIQRRTTGNLDFYRGWEEYKYGFGDVGVGEFWLGNEIIHRMTMLRRYELMVLFTYNGNNYYARYRSFRVFGEAERYKLKISGYSGGNAGDGLTVKHHDMAFSTFDRDNDRSTGNCAKSFEGAWWYNACHEVNLNGRWGSTEKFKAVTWNKITGDSSSVTSTEMKIRPI
ncbi:ficolin-1-like [Physella acuta]|uniref:ficolin-1-like n=1 Tax=Physella acuta TaxID=109671 RepID=UPI0027DB60C5|nr:ficolin-1-like [Physella acuta]